MASYSPAEAAEKSGFSLDTLRYYERIGLLREVARNSGGHRVFSDNHLGWLELLRCLRDTGMPIAAMQRFVELSYGDDDTIPARVALLEEHDRAVERQLAHLRAQQRHIRDKLRWYRSHPSGAGC
jgi:DNA-binding transcriptional MerR regulator